MTQPRHPSHPPHQQHPQHQQHPRQAVVLDLDHTMVGDVVPVLRRYRLLTALRDMGLRAPPPDSALDDAIANTPLLRPGLVDYLRRRDADGSAVHVFTASERTWAQAVVRAIQRSAGITFARPLFARDDCIVREPDGSLRKSLATVAARALLRGPKAQRCALANTTVIDNTAVWDDLGQARFVLAPTYEYRPVVDPLEGVPVATLRDPRARAMVTRLCSEGTCYDTVRYDDPSKSACHKHRWLARDADAAVKQNKPHLQDAFFAGL